MPILVLDVFSYLVHIIVPWSHIFNYVHNDDLKWITFCNHRRGLESYDILNWEYIRFSSKFQSGKDVRKKTLERSCNKNH